MCVFTVPIQVVASFKKVKAVVSGNSQLATVLQNSAKLVSAFVLIFVEYFSFRCFLTFLSH